MLLDSEGDIIFDANGANFKFKDDNTPIFELNNSSSDLEIFVNTADKDIKFGGNDGGSTITALTLDMSSGGRANFNNDIGLNDDRGIRLGSDDDSVIYNDGSNLYIKNSTSNHDIIFQGNDDGSAITAMTIDMSVGGYVGIGTTSPAVPLDIQSNSAASAIRIRGRSDDIAEVDFYNNANDSVMARFQVDTGYFATHVGGSERMRIDNSGRVGIPAIGQVNVLGTQIPYLSVNGINAQNAHVNIHRHRANSLGGYLSLSKSRSDTKDFTIVQANDELGTISFQGADGSQFQQAAQIQAEVDGTPGSSDMPGRLVFLTTVDGGVTPAERMRIGNTGKTIVQPSGSGDNVEFFVETQNSSDTGIAFGRNGTNNLKTGMRSASAGSSSAMFMKLSLSESAGAITNSSPQFTFYYNGNLTATGSVSSDRRLKENIVDIPDGSTALIKSLNPVSFNLIGSPVHKAGFIAQEVETVKSSLVNGGEEDEEGNETIRGVDYYGILAHAVKTIQELEARITTLEG